MTTVKILKDIKTLNQLASVLGITEFKGIKICGLDYFYSEDSNVICVYYKNSDLRYTYTDIKAFIEDHAIENINDLTQLN